MTRKMIAVSAVLAIVISGSIALAQPGPAPVPGAPRQPAPPEQRQTARLRQEMSELKATHAALIAELQAIHALAVKEKAPMVRGPKRMAPRLDSNQRSAVAD